MAIADHTPVRLVLPPDGRQTRIEFFRDRPPRKHSTEWWHAVSSWFRGGVKSEGPDLGLFDEKMKEKGFSEKTRKSYLFMLRRFLEYYEDLDPAAITMGEIEDYNFEFFVSGRYSRSYQLQFINAVRHYFRLTRGIDLNLKNLRKTGLGRKWS